MPWDHGEARREPASLPPGFMENIWKTQCNLESGYLESKLIRLIKGGLQSSWGWLLVAVVGRGRAQALAGAHTDLELL